MVYEKPFIDQYPRLITTELRGADTLLDVGCGTGSNLERIHFKADYCVGVDIDEPSIDSRP